MTIKTVPPLQRHAIPPGTAALADHEALARQHLNDNAWAYFSGGAADGFAELLDIPLQRIDNLVLHGLAVFAASHPQ